MKQPPQNIEFERFTAAMRGIMQVPKSAIYTSKREKQKPTSSASRVPAAGPAKRT
jgi:hypothetical protein